MKNIVVIWFCFFFGLNFVNGQIETVLFEENICENIIRLENSFTGNALKEFKNLFNEDNISFIKAITDCSSVKYAENNIDIDKVYLGTSIIEICYKDGRHQKVYNGLRKLCKQKDWKNDRIILDYFKPGKIVILDVNRSIVKIISSNFCANAKKQKKLINKVIENDKYSEMFYVQCGVYNLNERINQ